MHNELLKLLNSITPLIKEEEELVKEYFKITKLTKGKYFLEEGNVNTHIGFINKVGKILCN